jgi:galactose mutarotase-like enzyme
MESTYVISTKDSKLIISKEGQIQSLILSNTNVIMSNPTSEDLLQQNKCYLMYPWQGRIDREDNLKSLCSKNNLTIPNRDDNNYPIHGLFLNVKKEKVNETKNSISFKILCTELNFPDVQETYSLTDNELQIETILSNNSKQDQYFYYGYHPFLNINSCIIDSCLINSNCNKQYSMTKEVLPELVENNYNLSNIEFKDKLIKNDEYDNLYMYDGIESEAYFEVYSPYNKISIGVRNIPHTEKDDYKKCNFNHFQIYTPKTRKEI